MKASRENSYLVDSAVQSSTFMTPTDAAATTIAYATSQRGKDFSGRLFALLSVHSSVYAVSKGMYVQQNTCRVNNRQTKFRVYNNCDTVRTSRPSLHNNATLEKRA